MDVLPKDLLDIIMEYKEEMETCIRKRKLLKDLLFMKDRVFKIIPNGTQINPIKKRVFDYRPNLYRIFHHLHIENIGEYRGLRWATISCYIGKTMNISMIIDIIFSRENIPLVFLALIE